MSVGTLGFGALELGSPPRACLKRNVGIMAKSETQRWRTDYSRGWRDGGSWGFQMRAPYFVEIVAIITCGTSAVVAIFLIQCAG